jgi:mannose-6-phosphate isomerase-like protein (cupin superfamily)
MTSCADQSTRRARAYDIAGPILPDCHTAQYCHLLAQILSRLLLPTGARSSAHLLPQNRRTIASTTGARSEPHLVREGEPHLVREGEPHLVREGEPHLVREGEPHLVGAIGQRKLTSTRR